MKIDHEAAHRTAESVVHDLADYADNWANLARAYLDLDRWKREAIEVESTWDCQAVGNLLRVPLGDPINPAIQPATETMKARIEELEAAIRHLEAACMIGTGPSGFPIETTGEDRLKMCCEILNELKAKGGE